MSGSPAEPPARPVATFRGRPILGVSKFRPLSWVDRQSAPLRAWRPLAALALMWTLPGLFFVIFGAILGDGIAVALGFAAAVGAVAHWLMVVLVVAGVQRRLVGLFALGEFVVAAWLLDSEFVTKGAIGSGAPLVAAALVGWLFAILIGDDPDPSA